MTGRPPVDPAIRFWARVEKLDGEDACWIYHGHENKGYPQFWNQGHIYAHIFSWVLHNGPVPAGLKVCHKCDVRRCVRPSHLWLGTQKQNLADMKIKGRRNDNFGPDNPMHGRFGPLSPTWGRKHTPEARAKISEKRRARVAR